ncbi:MAG: ABC transporter substrate-binding protein [Chlamydiia bacterium]|nr:ABC transporter substrate-binding protein [Chlamydiia bacterium]
MVNWFRSLALYLALLFIWEGYGTIYRDMHFILSAPSQILYRLIAYSDQYWHHTLVTLSEMGGGFLLAFCVAFPLAWVMYLWNTARLFLQPIFVIIQCLPMFTLAPIMIIWFDWSYTAILVPTALMIFFPLTMNIYQGLRSVPTDLIDYFRLHHASCWQTFTKLQIPWAIPHICSGIRISSAIAGVGAVAGEWAGAQEGLGVLMLEHRRGADLEGVFAALLCLTTVSLSLYCMALLIEKIVYSPKPVRVFPKIKSLSTILILFLILGCSKSDTPRNTTRLLLDWIPNPNHVPLYVGIEKGFFKNEGINLHIQKSHDPGDVLPYIISEQVELGLSYTPHTVRAINSGSPLYILTPYIEDPLNSIIFDKSSGIQSIADLNDKVIGYCVDGSQTKFLDTLLKINGVVPKAKRNVGSDLVSAMGLKRVDAIYGGFFNIEAEQMRSYGMEPDYFTLPQLGVAPYWELVILTKRGSSQMEEAFLTPFRTALQASINWCQENPNEAF